MKNFKNKYNYEFPYEELSMEEYDPYSTALKINNLHVALSEWWDFYGTLFEQLNGFSRMNKVPADIKIVKIPFISREEMWRLGL